MLESPYRKPAFTPPPCHPRLMLTERDLPRIRENLERPENKVARSLWEKLCHWPVDGRGADPSFGSYHLAQTLAVEARAFRALLTKDPSHIQDAITSLMTLLNTFEVKKGNMAARWGGHLIFTAAQVYDWCHTGLTETQKDAIIARCEQIAIDTMEMKYPPRAQHAISGHGGEAQLLRDLLAFSIAVYDRRPDIYDFCAGRLLDEYVPEYRTLLASGAHPQGPTYGSYRWVSLCWAELLFEAMSGKIFRPFDFLLPVAQWLAYMTRPDGQDVRLGDAFNANKAAYNRNAPFTVPFFYAYALSGSQTYYDLFLQGFDPRFLLPERHGIDYYDEGSWGEGLLSPVSLLIFDRAGGNKKTAPDASLPAACYFGYPVGMTVWKRGETHVMMKIGMLWGSNHDHLDTGCFQFYHGAPLLTDSGVYDSYSSPHRRHYLTHTSAHNCLTIEEPDRPLYGEWREGSVYDGGTRRPGNGAEPDTVALWEAQYRMATVIDHSESDEGCSLTGDLSPAYVHSARSVIRSMTYRDCDSTLTVHDTVSLLRPDSVVAFHLHVQEPPVIQGNTVLITNRGHKALCRVINPENAVITARGGEQGRFVTEGTDYPPAPPYVEEAGWGEVRITPDKPANEVEFLVEITALSDNG